MEDMPLIFFFFLAQKRVGATTMSFSFMAHVTCEIFLCKDIK